MDTQQYLSIFSDIQKERYVDIRGECFVRTSKWDRIICLKKQLEIKVVTIEYVINFQSELLGRFALYEE